MVVYLSPPSLIPAETFCFLNGNSKTKDSMERHQQDKKYLEVLCGIRSSATSAVV